MLYFANSYSREINQNLIETHLRRGRPLRGTPLKIKLVGKLFLLALGVRELFIKRAEISIKWFLVSKNKQLRHGE